MKVLLVVSVLAMSLSSFAKSSNQKIAYCVFTERTDGKVKVQRFSDEEVEQTINMFHSIDSVEMSAKIRVEPGKLKKNSITHVTLKIKDTESKASSFAAGYTIPGQTLVGSVSPGENNYQASCGVIDDKFLEDNQKLGMTYILIKRELDKNN